MVEDGIPFLHKNFLDTKHFYHFSEKKKDPLVEKSSLQEILLKNENYHFTEDSFIGVKCKVNGSDVEQEDYKFLV